MHPSEVLFQGKRQPLLLPACDHYAGSEKLMRKSMALQQELGPLFDITFDCEDGAAAGAEKEHAQLVAALVNDEGNRFGRIGVRVHDSASAAFRAATSPPSCGACAAQAGLPGAAEGGEPGRRQAHDRIRQPLRACRPGAPRCRSTC